MTEIKHENSCPRSLGARGYLQDCNCDMVERFPS